MSKDVKEPRAKNQPSRASPAVVCTVELQPDRKTTKAKRVSRRCISSMANDPKDLLKIVKKMGSAESD